MQPGTRRFWTRALIVIGALGLGAIAAGVYLHGRIFVTVHNTTGEPLRDVRAVVTGATASLGDIDPAEARTCAVVPSGDSHLVVTFVAPDGAPRERTVDIYLQRGNSGTVDVWLSDEPVVKQDVDLWWRGP